MSDEWMPSLQLKLSPQEFDQLPRHSAYKYEIIDGVTHLSPWPRYYHAQLVLNRLHLESCELPGISLRQVQTADCLALAPIFSAAFARLQPFGSLTATARLAAAERCLQRSFSGGDGPLVEAASFVASENNTTVGAILITLLPGGDPIERDSYGWQETPPADLWAQRQGQPHLTWIFVTHLAQKTGIGSQLLHAAVRVLREQGYTSLWTTFLLGNEATLLWHWRNGFELFPHRPSRQLTLDGARRRVRQSQ